LHDFDKSNKKRTFAKTKKLMRIRLRKLYLWLGGLLGLSGCDLIGEIGDVRCMYGTPYADYNVDISVCDEDNKPIKGIQISAYGLDPDKTVYTDVNGKAKFDVSEMTLSLTLTDIDGEANGGEFKEKTVKEEDLTVKKTGKGDGAWYEGKYSAKGIVKMVK